LYNLDNYNVILYQAKACNMNQSLEILKELADIIVNASLEKRVLSEQEHVYFDQMFDKALELSFLQDKIEN